MQRVDDSEGVTFEPPRKCLKPRADPCQRHADTIEQSHPINSACQGVIALKIFLHYVLYNLYYILTPNESSATLTHRVVLLNEWESDRSPILDIPHVGFRE